MNPDDILNDKEAEAELRAGRKQKRPVTREEHGEYVQQRLRELFGRWKAPGSSEEGLYYSALDALKDLSVAPTGQDIADFCANKKFEDWNADNLEIFISALLNNSIGKDETVTVCARQWIFDRYVGAFLEKGTLVVEGNLRDRVGYRLKGGKVVVRGAVQDKYGEAMEDGELTIEGGVSGGGAHHVKGGHIVIKAVSDKNIYGSDGIAGEQEGGLIEIHGDVPSGYEGNYRGVGCLQKGGDLKIYGNVHCSVSTEQEGGTTYVEEHVVGGVCVGMQKTGGETIIKGGCLKASENVGGPVIGLRQEGGRIVIKGSVEGSIAYDGYPSAEIIIEGNVVGDVGDYYTAGTRITITGSVTGNVGGSVRDFECTISGDVRGDVGSNFGNYYDMKARKRTGRIEIGGSVYGDVGSDMKSKSFIAVRRNVYGRVGHLMTGGEIHVDGDIKELGESFGGKVFQRGRDVTYIPIKFRILNRIARRFGGELE